MACELKYPVLWLGKGLSTTIKANLQVSSFYEDGGPGLPAACFFFFLCLFTSRNFRAGTRPVGRVS